MRWAVAAVVLVLFVTIGFVACGDGQACAKPGGSSAGSSSRAKSNPGTAQTRPRTVHVDVDDLFEEDNDCD